MNRADNTGAKNFDIMIVKSILIYFEDNARVIVNVKGEMKGSEIMRPVSREHLERDRQRCCVHSRTAPVTFEYVQRADGSVEPGNHTVVISTQHSEHLKTVRSKEVAVVLWSWCELTLQTSSRTNTR